MVKLIDYHAAAQEAARRAAVVLEEWRQKFQVREKGRFDLVTDADLASQKAIYAYLSGRFPDHAFFGDEEAEPKGPAPAPMRRRRGSSIRSTAPRITFTIVRCTVYPLDCKSRVNLSWAWCSTRSPGNEMFHAAR